MIKHFFALPLSLPQKCDCLYRSQIFTALIFYPHGISIGLSDPSPPDCSSLATLARAPIMDTLFHSDSNRLVGPPRTVTGNSQTSTWSQTTTGTEPDSSSISPHPRRHGEWGPRHKCQKCDAHPSSFPDRKIYHYFECLKASERSGYLESIHPRMKEHLQKEISRIYQLRRHYEANPHSKNGILLNRLKESLESWRMRAPESRTTVEDDIWEHGVDLGKPYTVEADMHASVIYFEDGRPYDVPSLQGRFPNQKVTVEKLLASEEENPLMEKCPENQIRYFHLPANNMKWLEQIIARFYKEEPPAANDLLQRIQPRKRTATQRLLRPEFWTGQLNGGGSEVHARHMRPLCEMIPGNKCSDKGKSKNMVMFMHYLHWETDRSRKRCADVVKDTLEKERQTKDPNDYERKQHLVDIAEEAQELEKFKHSDKEFAISSTVNTKESAVNSQTTLWQNGPSSRKKLLGHVLLSAASLAEAMNSQAEEELVQKYLNEVPFLHPRRTLDQSHYGSVKSTQTRDRDQVVYRGTVPSLDKCPNCLDDKSDPERPQKAIVKQPGYCDPCRMSIAKKVPRIIMVLVYPLPS
jgi:hypothetical protein